MPHNFVLSVHKKTACFRKNLKLHLYRTQIWVLQKCFLGIHQVKNQTQTILNHFVCEHDANSLTSSGVAMKLMAV